MTSENTNLLDNTLAGREYAQFLIDYGFQLVLDENGKFFSCTVFKNGDILLAFTYQMNFGENLAVAELGAPVDVEAICSRSKGWSLIGEVWKDAYTEFHNTKEEMVASGGLSREQEVALVDRALRLFMSKVRDREVSIGNPAFRMDG